MVSKHILCLNTASFEYLYVSRSLEVRHVLDLHVNDDITPLYQILYRMARDGLRYVTLLNYATLRFDFSQNYATELRYLIFVDY